MLSFLRRIAVVSSPNTRNSYGWSRIGCRDVVGHGCNSQAVYKDDAHFPFPAIRFRENDAFIACLREKEMNDWKMLSCEEKKALYRASFCQTFSEFQANTGVWKLVMGSVFITTSFAFWAMMFSHFLVNEPLPESLSDERQAASLRQILETRTNPIEGISSKWDYTNDKWKEGCNRHEYIRVIRHFTILEEVNCVRFYVYIIMLIMYYVWLCKGPRNTDRH